MKARKKRRKTGSSEDRIVSIKMTFDDPKECGGLPVLLNAR